MTQSTQGVRVRVTLRVRVSISLCRHGFFTSTPIDYMLVFSISLVCFLELETAPHTKLFNDDSEM